MSTHTRRRFLATAAAALPLVAVTPGVDAGEAPSTADQALLAIVRQRFKFLTADQLKIVQRQVQLGIAAADILKRVQLDPVDEPATVFVADAPE